MWPFKRKKDKKEENQAFAIQCTNCGSTRVRVKTDSAKAWRGERYLTCRCLDCGRDFYADEPPNWQPGDLPDDEDLVDDEEALEKAEEELRRQIEDNDDRMFG